MEVGEQMGVRLSKSIHFYILQLQSFIISIRSIFGRSLHTS